MFMGICERSQSQARRYDGRVWRQVAAVAVGDARVGVLLSFLFLEAERGGVQALGVAPAVRLRLLFHQRCNMVINEFLYCSLLLFTTVLL